MRTLELAIALLWFEYVSHVIHVCMCLCMPELVILWFRRLGGVGIWVIQGF